jgi:hypothetical protein
MIISKLEGGLGNQMFQYATGFALAQFHHTDFLLDNLFLLDKTKRHYIFTHRNYELDTFHISAHLATPQDIRQFIVPRKGNKYWYHLKKRMFPERNVFHESKIENMEDFYQLPANAYLEGIFQRYALFADYIHPLKKEFSFKTVLKEKSHFLLQQILQNTSVCMHVRRGDYVGHPSLNIIDLDYYKKAFELLKSKLSSFCVFIFSDDINWCRSTITPELLGISTEIYFIDDEALRLLDTDNLQWMTQCKHFIIPNSTYSYWGALLCKNADKIVIAPKKWYKGQQVETNAILPSEWIAL